MALDSLYLRLFQVERLRIDSSWNTPNVRSSYWRFYRNDADGAALALDGGLYPLEADHLYFVPAGVHFSCRNTVALSHFYVHFDVLGVSGPMMRELFATPLCIPDDRTLRAQVEGLSHLVAGAGSPAPPSLGARGAVPLLAECQVKSLLYAALAAYLATVPPERMARCGQQEAALEPIRPALDWIEGHLAEHLANGDLAARCCLSEDYFIRRFRECVGQTPAQYVQGRRVQRAAQQLLFTPHTIERIAEETGFGNRFYFARIFTRHTGLSPAAYRKATRV